MEERRKKLLGQIADGVIIFQPPRRTSRELTEFQRTAGELLALEKEGLIGRCILRTGEIAGQNFYDEAQVVRGLTQEGRAALDAAQRADGTKPQG